MTRLFGSLRIGMGLALAAAAIAGAAGAQEFKLRLGHPIATADAAHTAMVHFADNVK